MEAQTLTYRDRAAAEAYARARAVGEPIYDAWLAALRAYGEDTPAARQRVNQVIETSN